MIQSGYCLIFGCKLMTLVTLQGIKHRECMTEAMKKEIQLLETTNYKAEIEILNSPQKPTFLVDSYLPWKLDTQVYIPL